MENTSLLKAEAAELVQQVTKPGQTTEKIIEIYDKWSEYDKHMESYSFFGPAIVSEAIIRHTSGNKDVYILDVAAGTGAVAQELKKVGYTNIDALEPSLGMLQIAQEKKLYKKYLKTFFTDNVDSIQTNTYDLLVTTGAMVEGHLKINTFPEMIRCVKPGGLVLWTMAESSLYNLDEYKDKMIPYIEHLQNEGQWQQLEKKTLPEYTCKSDGLLFVFRITKTT